MAPADELFSQFEAEMAAGRYATAQLYRAKCGFPMENFNERFAGQRPISLTARKPVQKAPAVAFLASFTSSVEDSIIPLKRGLNRVGHDFRFGDYEKPAPRVIESRQWIVVCAGDQVLVMDDHSTNGSIVLPRELASLGSADPRFVSRSFSIGDLLSAGPGTIKLDWGGTTVHELREGDVLATVYAAFVFGRVPPTE